MKDAFWLIIMSLICLSMTACDEGSHFAPVTEISTIETIPISGMHRVASGETLYEIAWRYGLDYRHLAASNKIKAPYAISAGQMIALRRAPIINKVTISSTASHETLRHTAQSYFIQPQFIVASSQKIKIQPIMMPANEEAKLIRWVWPAQGKVLDLFSGLNKGVNIVGRLGDPIYAASAGRVVYCGNGLRAYGNLIIIKHNSLYLSAYAHNRNILIREGEWVKKGQKIAEMGNTGSNNVMLHFEIRRAGKPINPLSLYR